MCGIFAYIGKNDSVNMVLTGLKKLEYRGYDSAGIAGIKNNEIFFCKEVGKVAVLDKIVRESKLELDVAIGQTRWATHGEVSKVNAHPHFNTTHTLALVHNGIIENHEALRKLLKEKGAIFVSGTDTEVIAHLIGNFYNGDILKAVQQAVPLLKGSFAFTVIHRDFPDQIIAVAHEAPLILGLGNNEAFISSDTHAFVSHTREVIFLSDTEVAVVKADHFEIYDAMMAPINKKKEYLAIHAEDVTKGVFEHYTLKEIYEQPQTIRNATLSRYADEFGQAIFEEINFDLNELLAVERIIILGCGTSFHAGCIAAYLLEEKARIPVQVEISSEFRYKNPVVPPKSLTLAISQSGETADTIAALRELKEKRSRVLSLCNVYGSTIARESDACFLLRAGPEIGVCSTKAFTSQIVVLSLFTLYLARMRHMSKIEGQEFIKCLKMLPEQVQTILDNSKQIEEVAKKYCSHENFFFLGRHYMYPTSLEGALKLKEISYINANGYPAGEMKHGPIALITPECPTVALCANKLTYDKMLSNLMEVKARKGKIIAIAEHGAKDLEGIADDIIRIPDVCDEMACIPTTVVTQLLAYYIAKERGADIDQPRNLAKSVTVE